jgi:hypothetical protein
MHDKFKQARKAAGWMGDTLFRVPDPNRPTGPGEEPFHAKLNAVLAYLVSHPDPAFRESGVEILEMGVAAGKVRKCVGKRTGLVSYTYGIFAANPNVKRG